MAHMKTPPAFRFKSVHIPESPAMTCIGYGTGVSVFSLERSPKGGQIRSPWAIKRVNKRTKPIDADKYERLLASEASILRSLEHPNIVGFRAFLEANDGRKCLAMEECEVSLGDMIELKAENGVNPFPENSIMIVVHDISKALSYLHDEHKLLHGDIKSYNILIKGDFEVAKLCDFGVCLKLNSEGVALPDQDYVGTECWSAPEVFEDNSELITIKSDIFSFGLVLWEMLSLKPPHISNVSEDVNFSFSEEDDIPGVGTRPYLPSNLGEEYSEVIHIFEWCTEANFDLRPTARDLLNHIDNISHNT